MDVLLFAARNIIKKFRKEEKNGRLDRIKGDRTVRTEDTHLLYPLQRRKPAVIKFKLKQGQRLEILLLDLAFSRLGYTRDKGNTPLQLGKHVDYKR